MPPAVPALVDPNAVRQRDGRAGVVAAFTHVVCARAAVGPPRLAAQGTRDELLPVESARGGAV